MGKSFGQEYSPLITNAAAVAIDKCTMNKVGHFDAGTMSEEGSICGGPGLGVEWLSDMAAGL